VAESGLIQLSDDILERYSRDSGILVFPSQIVAQSWIDRIATIRGVCESGRLISWDEFKERTFFGAEERRPANRLVRSLFLNDLLSKNGKSPVLRSLVPPRFAERSGLYKAGLLSLLPMLSALRSTGTAELEKQLGRSLAADIDFLHDSYSNFLDHHDRYEPAWLAKRFYADGRKYCIVFPDLLEDFSEYRRELEASAEIKLFEPEYERYGSPGLTEYQDYRQEMISVLAAIARDLREGIHPSGIAISLAGYDGLESRLSYFAASAGIPILPRKGKTLLEYPSVRWLERIRAVYAGDFSFQSLRKLLLDPGLIWRDPDLPRAIVQRAVDVNLLEGGERRWRKLVADVPGASALFDRFDSIYRARDMDQLYESIYAFLGTYVQSDRWETVDEMAWQRSADSLKELSRGLQEFPGAEYHAFPLALETLGSGRYIPQSETPGVAVYDYRVAAGMFVEKHYCLNFSAEATRLTPPASVLLREDQSRALLGTPVISPVGFLRAYGASGSTVEFSFSRRVLGSATLPAAAFLNGDRRRVSTGLPDFHQEVQARGPAALPWDKQGLRLDRELWKPGPDEILVRSLGISGDGVSVTDLEAYQRCPFAYLLSRLKLEELLTSPREALHREIGIAFHRFMELLLDVIREEDQRYRRERLEDYRILAGRTAKRFFGLGRDKRMPGIPELVQRQIRPRFESAAGNILSALADLADGAEISTEREGSLLVTAEDGDELVLRGRIDLMLEDPDGSLIFDYKTGSPPTATGILGGAAGALPELAEQRKMNADQLERMISDLDVRAESFQLPAYALFAAEEDKPVRRMGYFSMKRDKSAFPGRYVDVLRLGDESPAVSSRLPLTSAAMLRRLEKGVLDALFNWRRALRDGDFRGEGDGCANCRFRQVCRRGFAVRMRGEG
jgi:hypothetical protein